MKKAKWLISFFIIMLCFILGSELYQNYTNVFSNQFFYFDISVVDDRTNLYNLLTKYANESDVGVFSVNRTTYSAHDFELTVYATDKAQKVLEDNFYISAGRRESFFSGKTEIVIKDFQEIINDESVTRYYFTGTQDQTLQIKDKIYNTFPTSYIHQEDSIGNEWLIGAIWIISVLFLLALTWLDIQFQKKEIFLKLSLGGSSVSIIVQNVLADTIVFTTVFAFTYFVLKNFIYLNYGIELALIIMGLFIVSNSLLYLTLLQYDYKQIVYGANINEQTLSNSYVLKVITMIVAIASLSVNINLIVENGRFLTYYQNIYPYEDYGLLSLSPSVNLLEEESYNEYSKLKTQIFLNCYKEGDIGFSLSTAYDKKQVPIIVLTDTMQSLISNQTLIGDLGSCDYHVFVPKNHIDEYSSDDISFALQLATNIFGQNADAVSYEVINYDNTDVLYFDFSETSKLSVGFDSIQNPLFVFCTISNQTLEEISQGASALAHESLFNNFLFKLTNQELEEISHMDCVRNIAYTSLVDQCEQYKSSLLRIVLLNSIISAFLLILEMIIITTILQLEYMVNAKELSIKKILGYSIFKKNRTVFLLNFLGATVSIISMIIFSLMFKITKIPMVLSVGLALTTIEVILIIVNIFKLEKTNIPKILKGGSL